MNANSILWCLFVYCANMPKHAVHSAVKVIWHTLKKIIELANSKQTRLKIALKHNFLSTLLVHMGQNCLFLGLLSCFGYFGYHSKGCLSETHFSTLLALHPNSKSSKLQTFGLGETIWADKFWAFGVFSAYLSAPILVLWVPCPIFISKSQIFICVRGPFLHLFLLKIKFYTILSFSVPCQKVVS